MERLRNKHWSKIITEKYSWSKPQSKRKSKGKIKVNIYRYRYTTATSRIYTLKLPPSPKPLFQGPKCKNLSLDSYIHIYTVYI